MSDPSSGLPGTLPDAGWYADPITPGLWRWWDGAAWTEHVHRPRGPEDDAVIAAAQAATAVTAPAALVPEAATPAAPAGPNTPGLVVPDPALAEPAISPASFLPASAQVSGPSIQAPLSMGLPKLHPERPAGYVPPVSAPFSPPAPGDPTPRVSSGPPSVASFRGRGSSLQAARAARTQAVEMQRPNPVAVVALVFGILALLAPIVVFALVAIFTGLFGLRKASESFPPSGRGAAAAGLVLGIISLLITAIASMIAMADPGIRAVVLGAI